MWKNMDLYLFQLQLIFFYIYIQTFQLIYVQQFHFRKYMNKVTPFQQYHSYFLSCQYEHSLSTNYSSDQSIDGDSEISLFQENNFLEIQDDKLLKQKYTNSPTLKLNLKMKVELCKNFVERNYCPYGYKCRFAHGLQELLKNTELNENFKTKRCKAFFQQCECKYGQRCNFKHDDRKLQQIWCRSKIRTNILNWYPEILLDSKKKSSIVFENE